MRTTEEKKAKRNEYLRGYYSRNKEKVAETVKRYVSANKEKVSQYRLEWCRRNKEKVAEYNRRTKAKHRERSRLYGQISKPGAEDLLRAKKNGCSYCGSSASLELDHRLPKSRGGADSPSNLQWLCKTCNRAKYDLTDEEFFAHVETLYLKRYGPGL